MLSRLRPAPALSPALSPPAREPRGLYLCIGLDRIDPAHYGTEGRLAAAEADARDVAALARAAGLAPLSGDGLILSRAATRDAVIRALQDLATCAAAGDLVLVHYSGHGGQVPDVGGEEADGLDETWCLYDGQLLDDELQLCLALFPAGCRVVVLSDSCHSGTVSRASATAAAIQVAGLGAVALQAGLTPIPTYRTLAPVTLRAAYETHRAEYREIASAARAAGGADRGIVRASVLLLSACQDNQVALDGSRNGLFTGTLLNAWAGGSYRGTYRQLHRAIGRRMPVTQSPQITLDTAGPLADERPFAVAPAAGRAVHRAPDPGRDVQRWEDEGGRP